MTTYSFRAECLADVNHFCTLCDIADLEVDTRVHYDTYPGYPDVMVEVHTTTTLEELEAVLRKVPDGHVMLQTLGAGLPHENSGLRNYDKEYVMTPIKPVRITDEPRTPIYATLIDGLIVIVGLLIFLVLMAWTQARDLEDAVAWQKEQGQKAMRMLADCMNGKALYDKKSNKAYFCEKVIEVSLNR